MLFALVRVAMADVPEQTDPDAESDLVQLVRYKPGRGLFLAHSKSAELRFDAYTQVQVSNDTDLPANGEVTTDYEVFPRRVRAFLRGKSEHFGFKVSVDFARLLDWTRPQDTNPTLGAGEEVLRSAWFEARASNELGVRFGYMKTPFGRQRMASSAALLMPIRAVATKKFTYERGLGLMLDGSLERGRIEFVAGISHEHVDYPWTDKSADTDAWLPPLIVARVVVNPWKRLANREASLRRSKRLRASLGVGVVYPTSTWIDTSYGSEAQYRERPVVGVDAAFEAWRLSGQCEGFARRAGAYRNDYDVRAAGTDWGGYLQLGYVVLANHIQVAARMGRTSERVFNDGPAVRSERSLGANFFAFDQRLTLQTMVSWQSKCRDEQMTACDPNADEQVVTLQLQGDL